VSDEVCGVSPLEAKKLVDSGYSYIDVRTETEFRLGHPRGALNVPFQRVVGSSAESADFLPVMQRAFAREHGLVIACATGVRSRGATAALRRAGFVNVVEMCAGFDGRRGPFGNLIEAGWRASGLPVTTGDDDGSFVRMLAGT
jgi:rhodanese-related sulfurtransferase